MNVTVSAELEKRIEELVERGAYRSADAVVLEALGSFLDLERNEDLEAVRRRLAIADAEIDRGEFLEYDASNVAELANDVHARGRRLTKVEG